MRLQPWLHEGLQAITHRELSEAEDAYETSIRDVRDTVHLQEATNYHQFKATSNTVLQFAQATPKIQPHK